MNLLPLIEAKRDGARLDPRCFEGLVRAVVEERVPDYQTAAFLMAVLFRGLDLDETRALTLAMRDSGEVLRWPRDPRPVVDKHSTGGVGDKVSLPLVPLLACLGFRVPMISGRGLGITGGTLDKLESIPGFRTDLPVDQFVEQVQQTGAAMGAAGPSLVPADRRLYALRDVTGTVPSIPLIAASILSKKLAEGLDALVLDVKFGAAAFMRERERASELACLMRDLGTECGVKTSFVISSMDEPLGRAAGNWLEVRESVDCLSGRGPTDLENLTVRCAGELLHLTGRVPDVAVGEAQARACLRSGAPLARWRTLLEAQGCVFELYERRLERDACAEVVRDLKSTRSGVVAGVDTRCLGEVIRELGGGRMRQGDRIRHEVGLDRLAKPGDSIRAGDLLCRIHAESEADADAATVRLSLAWRFETEDGVGPNR